MALWATLTKVPALLIWKEYALFSLGVVHMGEKDFAVRCTSLNHCAVVYASGLHVIVWRVVDHNQLAAMVEVPQTFYNRTVGLMGLWSSNRFDDFLMSNGRILLSTDLNPPSEERLHDFGLSCEWILDACLMRNMGTFRIIALDLKRQTIYHFNPLPTAVQLPTVRSGQ